MGDSVQRGMYKDLVALCNDGWFMTGMLPLYLLHFINIHLSITFCIKKYYNILDDEKRAKGEPSYRGDRKLFNQFD